jgi:hypothetical protein
MTTTVEAYAPVEVDIPSQPLSSLLVVWAPFARQERPDPGVRRLTMVPEQEEPTWEDAEWQ